MASVVGDTASVRRQTDECSRVTIRLRFCADTWLCQVTTQSGDAGSTATRFDTSANSGYNV